MKIWAFCCIICLCSYSEQKGHQFFIEGKPWPYIANVGCLSSLFNTLGFYYYSLWMTPYKDRETDTKNHSVLILCLVSFSLHQSLCIIEIKPCGLGYRIQDVVAFWYKQKSKSFTLCHCLWLSWLSKKLKNVLIFFSEVGGWFFLALKPSPRCH